MGRGKASGRGKGVAPTTTTKGRGQGIGRGKRNAPTPKSRGTTSSEVHNLNLRLLISNFHPDESKVVMDLNYNVSGSIWELRAICRRDALNWHTSRSILNPGYLGKPQPQQQLLKNKFTLF